MGCPRSSPLPITVTHRKDIFAMMQTKQRLNWITICLLLLVTTATHAQSLKSFTDFKSALPAATQDSKPPIEGQVRASLLADVTALEPDASFTLAVQYEIIPDWHIYWHNSGDVGYATEILWELPEGFEVGPLQWPAPDRFIAPGPLISYGYHDKVILYATVKTPDAATLGQAPVTLKANTSWLACKETCIPGDAEVALTLPVGTAQPAESAEAIAASNAKVPTTESGEVSFAFTPAQYDPASPPQQIAVTLELPDSSPWQFVDEAPSSPQLYPFIHTNLASGQHASVSSVTPASVKIDWPLEWSTVPDTATPALKAVVRYTLEHRESKTQSQYAIEIAIPNAQANTETNVATPVTGNTANDDVIQSDQAGASDAEASVAFRRVGGEGNANRSALYFLLLAFLGGMLLNVMPCVLPVISLKIMGFVGQAGQSPRRIFQLGLTYALGVLSSFLVLAGAVLALKAFGTSVGWGFQLQSPTMVAILCAVVFAFGLSLFGVFTIDLSGAVSGKTEALSHQEGHMGSFFNGVLATILATPCTAPMLGPALGFAFAQSAPMIVLFFLTIGAGLAFPYVLLSARPGWLKYLPKPGPWMETFKQFMGFLLMATALWLVTVFGALTDESGLGVLLFFLLLLAFLAWMLGLWTDFRAPRWRRRAAWPLAVLAAGLAFYWLPARHIGDVQARWAVEASATATNSGADKPLHWREQIARERAAGRIVFVDFTADWCQTCKVNERFTLHSEEVENAFAQHDVALVKVDWTRRDDEIRQELAKYGASGVPLYVIMPPEADATPVVLPELITPGIVVEQIENVASAEGS